MSWVLHVDLDQFVAAVEVLRDPSLAGRPVVVGGRGDPTERAVVSTASYEARAFGIGSGMPLRVAARKLPDAVFLPVDAPLYEAASAEVMDILRQFDAVVQVLGWDEAFLGIESDEPRVVAQAVQHAVLAGTGLRCSVGIGDNKLRAKIATDFGKPRGTFLLTSQNWVEVMADRPTDALWGVGRKTAKKLAALGIETVRQLATADPDLLAERLGPTMGPYFHRLGNGVDHSPVDDSTWVPRGRGRETTYQQDLADWTEIEAQVRVLAAWVCADLLSEGRAAVRVGLKVRYVPFETHTASAPLPEPTVDGERIADAAAALVARFDHARAVRLLGVRLEMEPPPP